MTNPARIAARFRHVADGLGDVKARLDSVLIASGYELAEERGSRVRRDEFRADLRAAADLLHGPPHREYAVHLPAAMIGDHAAVVAALRRVVEADGLMWPEHGTIDVQLLQPAELDGQPVTFTLPDGTEFPTGPVVRVSAVIPTTMRRRLEDVLAVALGCESPARSGPGGGFLEPRCEAHDSPLPCDDVKLVADLIEPLFGPMEAVARVLARADSGEFATAGRDYGRGVSDLARRVRDALGTPVIVSTGEGRADLLLAARALAALVREENPRDLSLSQIVDIYHPRPVPEATAEAVERVEPLL